jgi:AraC-like DNA-binding protein
METAADRSTFLGHIRRLIASSTPERMEIARPGPLPEFPATCSPAARLVSVLSGTKNLRAAIGGNIAQASVSDKTALFCMPYGWIAEDWDSPHEMLAIIYNADFTRYLRILNRGGTGNAEPKMEKEWHHTNRPPSDAVFHILKAIAAPDVSERVRLQLRSVLIELASAELERTEDKPEDGKAASTWKIVREFIADHFDEGIDRSTVARAMGISPGHLSRLAIVHSGIPFHDYLRRFRMERAQYLLENTSCSVKEIAGACGFSDSAHFIRVFSAVFGTSPGRFRCGAASEQARREHPGNQ